MIRPSRRPGPRERTGLALVLLVLGAFSCAGKGLVRESYPETFYRVPKLTPDGGVDGSARFIVFGDNRPGWMAREIFLKRDSWLTWKQLYLPVIYQGYLLGSGIVGGINYLRWAPDYGHDAAARVRDAIRARARRGDIEFIINTGDLVTDGRRPNDWKRFLDQYKNEVPLLLEYPFLPAVGNHERANDSTHALPNFTDVFGYPPFYVLEHGEAAFFFIDSDYIIDQYQLIEDGTQDRLFEQWFVSGKGTAWLEERLASNDKPHKIVIMHHPPVSFGEHSENWTDPLNGRELQNKRGALLQLLRRHGVRILFCGHQHMYEHNAVTYTNQSGAADTLRVVITGGGGAPLHRGYTPDEVQSCLIGYGDEGLDAACLTQKIAYNYCVVDVTPAAVVIEAYEVAGSGAGGDTLIDRIVVAAPGGPSQP